MSTPVEELPRLIQFESKRPVERYGHAWPEGIDELSVELLCFRADLTVERGGLGAVGHFWEIVRILWGPDNEQKHFIRNPWADIMLEEALRWKYLSVAGAASSGKSLFYAIFSIVFWLADPANTTVLITSTSLKESKGRIWADIEEWWNAAQHACGNRLPGKLVTSLGLIKLDDPTGRVKASDRSGIHLIAGEKRKEKETIGKLVGYKNKRFLFIGDEMPELSGALIEAATGNLDSTEKEVFKFIGIGNPNSIYDPHGLFSKPKNGWKSINPGVFEWETDLGYCIRFDAYQSPNILAGEILYKWLPTLEKVESKKKQLGAESLAFWRMWRGYWCPTGGTESVVSEADIIGFDAEDRVKKWLNPPMKIAFLDPGYTNGGDRSILYFGNFGINAENKLETLEFDEYIVLHEDTMNTKVDRSYQIVWQFRDECLKRGVIASRAAVDDTGATSFGDIVHTEWSRDVMRTKFGGSATMLAVSTQDKTPACDKYHNRVSEIWCSMREYIRCGQIRGISKDFAIELTARQMVHNKSGKDLKAQVETKEKMKARAKGMSPDIADAGCGLLDLLRAKFRFRAAAKRTAKATTAKNYKKFQQRRGAAFATATIDRSA
jgi:hypothetical protein